MIQLTLQRGGSAVPNSIKKFLGTLTIAVIVAASVGIEPSSGQSLSVIAQSRRTDWSQAGASTSIPTRTTICATFNPGATVAQINSAIASCPNGQIVELGAGTFNLSGTINIYRSNITLRGQGMATILNFSNSGSSNYYWGSTLIAVQHSGFDPSGDNVAPGFSGVPASTVRDWVGTNGQVGVYTQGATILNLSTSPAGLTVGGTLTLWQSDPPDNTVPHSGYFVSAKNGVDGNNVAWQGAGQTNRSGQQQRVKVVAINGTQVTVWPGIYRPSGTWATARAPKAGWQSGVANAVGLENFRIMRAVGLKTVAMIAFNAAADCWVSGLGVVGGVGGGDYGIQLIDSRHMTIRNSWWEPFRGGGVYTTTSYGITMQQCSGCLIENNILNGVESPIMLNSGTTGSVVAYNFENYSAGEGGLQTHEEGTAMNLFEGNRATKFWADEFHGNTALNTLFRNNFFTQGIDLWSYHRWYNLVGNVISSSVYKSIYSDATKYNRWSGVAFRLGYASQNASAGSELSYNVFPDPIVASSTMIWGNYVTAGASTRWLASEVPSSDPVFPNPVPTDQLLPASFYLSAKPNWWPAANPWPAIGPDVNGGDIAGFAGHAYSLPAQNCFTASGSLIANFNTGNCYPIAGGDSVAPTVSITISTN
jgi:hypothetical protein